MEANKLSMPKPAKTTLRMPNMVMAAGRFMILTDDFGGGDSELKN
jgi:hypothetical protein